MDAVAAELIGAATGTVTATADITTAIALTADVIAILQATADLTTAIAFEAQGLAVITATGTLAEAESGPDAQPDVTVIVSADVQTVIAAADPVVIAQTDSELVIA